MICSEVIGDTPIIFGWLIGGSNGMGMLALM
jgi:hypothetical protein